MPSAVRFQLGELTFTWDLDKYEMNVQKHGITYEEAATTWMDVFAIESFDEGHSDHEDRWLRIGTSLRGALLVTWSTERSTKRTVVIRIIGARRATAKEQVLYDKKKERQGD